MNRAILCLCLVLFLFSVGYASEDLLLTPKPKHCDITGRDFRLEPGTVIEITTAFSEKDRFALDLLRDRIAERAGLTLPVQRLAKGPKILLGVGERDVELLDREIGTPPSIPAPESPEGYLLDVNTERAVIFGWSAPGLFYGVQTFIQLMQAQGRAYQVPGVRIVDWPASPIRGVMVDSSQGALPTVEIVKRIISNMAEFKLNRYYMYAETAVEFTDLPLVGEIDGRYSPEEIAEIVEFGRTHFVDIVPCAQFHGHLHPLLKIERYSDLGEIPHGGEVSPGDENVYRLLESFLDHYARLFPADVIHIGGDETWELGTGRSQERMKGVPRGKLYLDHFLKIYEMVSARGKKCEMWGDIFLKYPETIKQLPKDVRVASWHYEKHENYDPWVKAFEEANIPFIVCPGTRCWNQVYPNYEAMRDVIDGFLARGRRAGAAGIMNTIWFDVCEELLTPNFYGIAYGGAAGWENSFVDRDTFDRAFAWVFHGDPEGTVMHGYNALLRAQLVGEEMMPYRTTSLFWTNPFDGSLGGRLAEWQPKLRELRLAAEDAIENLLKSKKAGLRNADMLDHLLLAARRFDYAGLKLIYGAEMSRMYRRAVASGDKDRMYWLQTQFGVHAKANQGRLYDLIYGAGNLKTQYRDVWNSQFKPYNLEGVLALWDMEIQQYWHMKWRLQEGFDQYNRTGKPPEPERFGFFVE